MTITTVASDHTSDPGRGKARGIGAGLTGKRPKNWLPLWFLAPAGIILFIFIFIPVGRSVYLSFFDASLLNPNGGNFVGLNNYAALLGGPRFWHSVFITGSYTIFGVVLSYGLGMISALFLNRKFRFRWLARILIIVPWAIPEVVAVMIFKWILDAQFGIANHVLVGVGILNQPIAWLSQPDLALPIVILVTVWIQYPLATLILLAGLQTVPQELDEAAQLDGAGAIKRFRHVTFPMLRFVNVVVLIILTLDTFRRTTLIYTMTGGGPARATETLPVWTYIEAFSNYSLGSASTIGVMVMVILVGITVAYFYGIVAKGHK